MDKLHAIVVGPPYEGMHAVAPPTYVGRGVGFNSPEPSEFEEPLSRPGRQADGDGQHAREQEAAQKAEHARAHGVEHFRKHELKPARDGGVTESIQDEERGDGDAHQRQGTAEADPTESLWRRD